VAAPEGALRKEREGEVWKLLRHPLRGERKRERKEVEEDRVDGLDAGASFGREKRRRGGEKLLARERGGDENKRRTSSLHCLRQREKRTR